ncbi:MAG: adenylyltransferase/cytidyltransferase family protein [Eubacteriales bacterium]|nr:adenylyltransferase/cytidyltransferase family protein [Eubacteriales bacterium]
MKRVITYGTFDLFHQGHYNIIKRARELGDYLIVGVTSESYDIERGKLNVRDSLLKRIENVRKTGFADEIIIEEYQGQKVSDIIKYNIDVLVVGSDWRGKFDYLKNYCDVQYLERTKNISSTQLRGEGTIYNIGVVTDDTKDNGIVVESKYVSGLHVESVYSEDEDTARRFCERYELDSYGSDFDKFLSTLDIVYIKSSLKTRVKYIERAIEQGKYVISDSPMTLHPDKLKELFAKAVENNVVLVEKIMLVYLRAFNQLVWLTHGDLVGNVVSVKCAISQDDFDGGKSFNETVAHAICAIIKLLGKNCLEVNTNAVKDEKGDFIYDMITMKYPETLATIEIGTTVDVEDEFVIIGSKGRITVPNDWWNTGYFEAKVEGNEFLKRFSFNFEGNGFRYLLQELMIMISDKRTECTRLFYEESEALVDILKIINQRG